MSQFDDLNEALAALKSEMRTATSATQAVSRLGDAATAMSRQASTVKTQLKDCETRVSEMEQAIGAANRSIEKLGQKSAEQWKSAVTDVLAGIGTEYVGAVANEVKQISGEFKDSVESLRAECAQRDDASSQHTKAVERRLKACEEQIVLLNKSVSEAHNTISMLDEKSIRQWKESTTTVLNETGREYIDAVASRVKESGEGFSKNIIALRKEWTQREHALRRAKKWIWILSAILILTVIGIAGIVASIILNR